jgi:mRNA interferase MazF
MRLLKRGDVWWVSFASALGGEVQKTRPALIISNNAANAVLNGVVVIPLTSQTDRLYPSEAYVDLGGRRSKAMADQITTADKRRLQNYLGTVSTSDLRAVERALLLHLNIQP